jgi:hypothetical protein
MGQDVHRKIGDGVPVTIIAAVCGREDWLRRERERERESERERERDGRVRE